MPNIFRTKMIISTGSVTQFDHIAMQSPLRGIKALQCLEGRSNLQLIQDSDALDMATSYRSFSSKGNKCYGWIFILLGSVSFLGFFYAAILCKLLPQSGNRIMSAIQIDRYYCLLVPLTLPVLVVAVYFHWLSMKLFKHA